MSLPHHSGRPIVGVPTQTLQSLGGVSAEIPASWVMSQRYILTLVAAGAIPVMIPLVDDDTVRGIYDCHWEGELYAGSCRARFREHEWVWWVLGPGLS